MNTIFLTFSGALHSVQPHDPCGDAYIAIRSEYHRQLGIDMQEIHRRGWESKRHRQLFNRMCTPNPRHSTFCRFRAIALKHGFKIKTQNSRP